VLGIRALRPVRNADAPAPNAANYDEALSNPSPSCPPAWRAPERLPGAPLSRPATEQHRSGPGLRVAAADERAPDDGARLTRGISGIVNKASRVNPRLGGPNGAIFIPWPNWQLNLQP
jgi:hypothetical protein